MNGNVIDGTFSGIPAPAHGGTACSWAHWPVLTQGYVCLAEDGFCLNLQTAGSKGPR